MADIWACFQSSGNDSEDRDLLEMWVSASLVSCANSLRSLGCIPSGPGDLSILFVFSFLSMSSLDYHGSQSLL